MCLEENHPMTISSTFSRFLFEIPIGFYVKLRSAVAAILVGGPKCRTQFWKGTPKGPSQQSLVEIGSVVSEEKILLKFHPPFSMFSLVAILVGSRDHRVQFWKGGHPRIIPPKFGCNWPSGF
jgi:hypothetical protein